MINPEFQTESLISRYQNDTINSAFMASPTEVIKSDEPLSNSEEITKVIENSEFYKRGFEDARKRYKRPQGEWIFGSTLGHGWMKCSNCCVSQSGQTSCWSYCPNCGADMRKEEEV